MERTIVVVLFLSLSLSLLRFCSLSCAVTFEARKEAKKEDTHTGAAPALDGSGESLPQRHGSAGFLDCSAADYAGCSSLETSGKPTLVIHGNS